MNTNSLLIATFGLIVAINSQAIDMTVTVNGRYEPSPTVDPDSGLPTSTSPFRARGANGETAPPTLVTASAPELTYDSYEEVWNEDTQEYEFQTVSYTTLDLANAQTIYQVTCPDTWVGRSVSFSWTEGATFTNPIPFLEGNSTFTFQASDCAQTEVSYIEEWWHPNLTVLGNYTMLGTWWSDTSRSLLTLQAWHNPDPGWPSVGLDMIASHSEAFWRWMHVSETNGEMVMAMDLDYEHRLTLRRRHDPTHGTQRIVLDPKLGRISINGEDVLTASSAGQSFVRRTGASEITGAVNVSGVIRVCAAGDISMGSFTSGSQP